MRKAYLHTVSAGDLVTDRATVGLDNPSIICNPTSSDGNIKYALAMGGSPTVTEFFGAGQEKYRKVSKIYQTDTAVTQVLIGEE